MIYGKTKKRIAVIPILLIIALIAGSCSGSSANGNSSSPSPATQTSAAATTSSDKAASQGKTGAGDAIVLTAMLEAMTDEGIVETDLDKALKDTTGVVIDRINCTIEKLALVSSSGDLPDIIHFFSSPDVAKNMTASGALQPLDSLLDQYGQNLRTNIPTALKWSKEIFGGGTTYIIPTRTWIAELDRPNRNGWYGGYYTRWDVYKAIGAPEMKNEDDYLDVLKKMMEYQPTNKDGKKVYGLTLWTDWGLWPFNQTYGRTYGYEILQSLSAMLNRETKEVQSQFLDPNGIFWQAMKFYNKAWIKGVLDPEGFVIKTDQVADKIKTGEVLATPANWWAPSKELLGEDAINVMLPGAFPVFADVFPSETLLGLQASHSLGISAKSAHADKAMQVIDWLNSQEGQRAERTGIKGVDWDVVNGRPQLMGKRLDDFLKGTVDEEFNKKRGLSVYYAMDVGSARMTDGYPPFIGDAVEYMKMSATPAEIDFATHYAGADAKLPGQAYAAMVKNGTVKTYPYDDVMPFSLGDPLPEEVTRVINQADQYIQANLSTIIMSATDAEFQANKEKTIAAVKAMGMDTAWEAILKNIEVSKQRASIFK